MWYTINFVRYEKNVDRLVLWAQMREISSFLKGLVEREIKMYLADVALGSWFSNNNWATFYFSGSRADKVHSGKAFCNV